MLFRIASLATAAAAISLVFVGGASATPRPSCPIDENGECITSNPLDAYTDEGWFEADYDSVYYNFSTGGYCFNANGIRRGSWWAVHFSRYSICVADGRVTTLGSAPVWFTGGLPYGMSYITSPDLNYSTSENGVGTGLATTSISYSFRWCGIISLWNVGCGFRVYGYITIIVGGYGGLSCYSDKGYIPFCRGRAG